MGPLAGLQAAGSPSGGQRVFFKALLEAEEVSSAELRDRLGANVALASQLSGLGRRINGTNLRSTGGRPGLVLICEGWVEGAGSYRARPEFLETVARLPDLNAYLRGATWEELTADSAYIGYEAG